MYQVAGLNQFPCQPKVSFTVSRPATTPSAPATHSVPAASPMSAVTTSTHTQPVTTFHSTLHIPREAGPRPGFTTMDPPPSMVYMIDQHLLMELTQRFPEVPEQTVMKVICQNGNNRENSMMALVRESQQYVNPMMPHVNSGGSLTGLDSQVNGLRPRSDSGGSRGSITNVSTGQSPTTQRFHGLTPVTHTASGAGTSVPYLHSASAPHASSNVNESYRPGPNTAPAQPESFQPFPNVRRSSGDHIEGSATHSTSYGGQYRQGWGGAGFSSSSGPSSWASHPSSYYRSQPAHSQHPAQFDNSPSRPGQFEQKFPPAAASWDKTFSPGSPARKPPSHGGTPTHGTQRSPATTPPRHHWEGTSPTTSPGSSYPMSSPLHTGYPYSQHRTDHLPPRAPDYTRQRPDHANTTKYVSSISKYIPASAEAAGSADNSQFVLTSLAANLPKAPGAVATTYQLPPDWGPAISSPPDLGHMPPSLSHGHLDNRGHTHGVISSPPSADNVTGFVGDVRPNLSSSLVGSEDQAYTQSLLLHQRERLDKLKQDMHLLLHHRELLQQNICHKEECILQRRREKISGHSASISMSDLQKVREENRLLQIDSHLKTLEFDRITKGQAVIGQEDPNADFYVNFNSGQLPISESSTDTPTPSTTTSSSQVTAPCTHPPAPPTLVPSSQNTLREVREVEEENWSCSACTFANHPELSSCEMCSMPRVGRR